MGKLFSLAELKEHLLKEVLRADQTFNINQDLAWRSMGKEKDAALFDGIRQLESLFLAEMKFTFWLKPVAPSFYYKVMQFLTLKKRAFLFYRLVPDAGDGHVQITLTVQRQSFKKYISEITSQPQLNPETTHVLN